MRFTLEIDCDNAAFDGQELSEEFDRIFDRVVDDLELGRTDHAHVLDSNGNTVGKWELS